MHERVMRPLHCCCSQSHLIAAQYDTVPRGNRCSGESLRYHDQGDNGNSCKQHTWARKMWKWAAYRAVSQPIPDIWAAHQLESLHTERAIRHSYHAHSQTWQVDQILVKIEPESFDMGSMRECFRLKAIPFKQYHDMKENWRVANNYVGKRYKKERKREVYFTDVKVQMEAKLWAERFNRLNPPKKVDIIMVSLIELCDRPDLPVLALEHLMEGKYQKYNSNNGFVASEDDVVRNTPQSFSHFTFEASSHEIIVVDIQGVDDLYTDPQFHTANRKWYGTADLGARGMALFFSTHICNHICRKLMLSPFDISDSERTRFLGAKHFGRGTKSGSVTRNCTAIARSPRYTSPFKKPDDTTISPSKMKNIKGMYISGVDQLSKSGLSVQEMSRALESRIASERPRNVALGEIARSPLPKNILSNNGRCRTCDGEYTSDTCQTPYIKSEGENINLVEDIHDHITAKMKATLKSPLKHTSISTINRSPRILRIERKATTMRCHARILHHRRRAEESTNSNVSSLMPYWGRFNSNNDELCKSPLRSLLYGGGEWKLRSMESLVADKSTHDREVFLCNKIYRSNSWHNLSSGYEGSYSSESKNAPETPLHVKNTYGRIISHCPTDLDCDPTDCNPLLSPPRILRSSALGLQREHTKC